MKAHGWIFILAMGLTLLGVTMVFSATGIYADAEFQSSFFFLRKELLWLAIGLGFLWVGYTIELSWIRNAAPVLFALTLGGVLLTYTPLGVKIGGAQRWIRLGFVNFQPSEFLKLGLVCFMAARLAKRDGMLREFWGGYLKNLLWVGAAMLPVLGQPDFGTAFMIALVGMIVLFVAGARVRDLGMTVLSSLPLAYYFIVNFPYRMRRVAAFLDPWKDPRGKGFQIVQSFLAIGRGKLTGVGLGESTQKLFYLPAAHTDFIFSILAEELGFVGSVTVITAFVLLAVTGYWIALSARDPFGSLLAAGMTSMISLQALFNIAVVTGTVPTKGIPLPFISFGGSSLALNLLAVGLIMNVAREDEKQKIPDPSGEPWETARRRSARMLMNGSRLRSPAWI